MEEIPESKITTVDGWLPPDVEAVALECLKDMAAFDPPVIARRIARAILAERERCARLCEETANKHGWNYNLPSVGLEMASRIREPTHDH